MIRIGIVGMGFMGATHYAAYDKLSDAKVVAFTSSSPERLRGDLLGVRATWARRFRGSCQWSGCAPCRIRTN